LRNPVEAPEEGLLHLPQVRMGACVLAVWMQVSTMKGEDLIGRFVEYHDKEWATRAGKVKKVYGSKATIELKYGRTTLRYERVPLRNIIKVKVGRDWVPWK